MSLAVGARKDASHLASEVCRADVWTRINAIDSVSKRLKETPLPQEMQLLRGAFVASKVKKMNLDEMVRHISAVLEGFMWSFKHANRSTDPFSELHRKLKSEASLSSMLAQPAVQDIWKELCHRYGTFGIYDISTLDGKATAIKDISFQTQFAAWVCAVIISTFTGEMQGELHGIVPEFLRGELDPTKPRPFLTNLIHGHHRVKLPKALECLQQVHELIWQIARGDEGVTGGSFETIVTHIEECQKEGIGKKKKQALAKQIDKKTKEFLKRLMEDCSLVKQYINHGQAAIDALLCNLVFLKTVAPSQLDAYEYEYSVASTASLSTLRQEVNKRECIRSIIDSSLFSADEMEAMLALVSEDEDAMASYAKILHSLQKCLAMFHKLHTIFLHPIERICSETLESYDIPRMPEEIEVDKDKPASAHSRKTLFSPKRGELSPDSPFYLDGSFTRDGRIEPDFLWSRIKRSPAMEARALSAYANSDRMLEDLIYHLSFANSNSLPLELFNVVVGICQVFEQRLTAALRHNKKDATIRSHNLVALLRMGDLELEDMLHEEAAFIKDANLTEIHSRDFRKIEVSRTKAASLLKRAYELHNGVSHEDVHILRQDVLSFVKSGIIAVDSLHRYFGGTKPIDEDELDAFLENALMLTDETVFLEGKAEDEFKHGFGDHTSVRLREWIGEQMKSVKTTGAISDGERGLLQLRTYLDHIENEVGRTALPLQHLRISNGEQYCYNFLKHVALYLCPELDLAACGDDYEKMFSKEIWDSLLDEEKEFLQQAGAIRYKARYERSEEDHFGRAEKAAASSKKKANSYKIKSTEDAGIILSRDGLFADRHFEHTYRLTLQIAEKILIS